MYEIKKEIKCSCTAVSLSCAACRYFQSRQFFLESLIHGVQKNHCKLHRFHHHHHHHHHHHCRPNHHHHWNAFQASLQLISRVKDNWRITFTAFLMDLQKGYWLFKTTFGWSAEEKKENKNWRVNFLQRWELWQRNFPHTPKKNRTWENRLAKNRMRIAESMAWRPPLHLCVSTSPEADCDLGWRIIAYSWHCDCFWQMKILPLLSTRITQQ